LNSFPRVIEVSRVRNLIVILSRCWSCSWSWRFVTSWRSPINGRRLPRRLKGLKPILTGGLVLGIIRLNSTPSGSFRLNLTTLGGSRLLVLLGSSGSSRSRLIIVIIFLVEGLLVLIEIKGLLLSHFGLKLSFLFVGLTSGHILVLRDYSSRLISKRHRLGSVVRGLLLLAFASILLLLGRLLPSRISGRVTSRIWLLSRFRSGLLLLKLLKDFVLQFFSLKVFDSLSFDFRVDHSIKELRE